MRYGMKADIDAFPIYLHGVMPGYMDIVYLCDASVQ